MAPYVQFCPVYRISLEIALETWKDNAFVPVAAEVKGSNNKQQIRAWYFLPDEDGRSEQIKGSTATGAWIVWCSHSGYPSYMAGYNFRGFPLLPGLSCFAFIPVEILFENFVLIAQDSAPLFLSLVHITLHHEPSIPCVQPSLSYQ